MQTFEPATIVGDLLLEVVAPDLKTMRFFVSSRRICANSGPLGALLLRNLPQQLHAPMSTTPFDTTPVFKLPGLWSHTGVRLLLRLFHRRNTHPSVLTPQQIREMDIFCRHFNCQAIVGIWVRGCLTDVQIQGSSNYINMARITYPFRLQEQFYDVTQYLVENFSENDLGSGSALSTLTTSSSGAVPDSEKPTPAFIMNFVSARRQEVLVSIFRRVEMAIESSLAQSDTCRAALEELDRSDPHRHSVCNRNEQVTSVSEEFSRLSLWPSRHMQSITISQAIANLKAFQIPDDARRSAEGGKCECTRSLSSLPAEMDAFARVWTTMGNGFCLDCVKAGGERVSFWNCRSRNGCIWTESEEEYDSNNDDDDDGEEEEDEEDEE